MVAPVLIAVDYYVFYASGKIRNMVYMMKIDSDKIMLTKLKNAKY
jgi:hypothetical protein